jgi:hypothetical protein
MKIVASSWEVLRRLSKRFGPYLLIEAALPGGTLLALLLYWIGHAKTKGTT